MGLISKTSSFSLGMLLTLAFVTLSSVHASMQEPGQENSSQAASSDSKSSQETTPPDKKPDNNSSTKQITDLPDQAQGQGKTAGTGDVGKSQKGKGAGTAASASNGKPRHPKNNSQPQGKPAMVGGGPIPIQNAAQQIVKTLDAAMAVLPRSGTAPPVGVPPGTLEDRRAQLQKEVQAAKDEAGWAGVADDAALLLADTVSLMQVKSGDVGSGAQKGNGPVVSAARNQPGSAQSDDESFFDSRRLPLYVAFLSLVLSIMSLAVGWLIAQRSINTALIEAGLI